MALTPDEKFRFDLAGYFVRESIIPPAEAAAIRDQVERALLDPQSLPPQERWSPGGASALLLDHPRIVDVLHETLGANVRCDTTWFMRRERGQSFFDAKMHRGAESWIDPLFGYRVHDGRIHAGEINVVIELTDVGEEDGGTGFIVGSHKANFPMPPEHAGSEPGSRSEFYKSYACPAGSAVFFNENLLHVGPAWRRETPRIAVLATYLPAGICYHRPDVPVEVIAALPREKQAWFREPWTTDFLAKDPERRHNTLENYVTSDEPFIGRTGRLKA
jgi:ectoine hydroxylase-related dioxygenase (phytanoyl-CoA dioxygenase family)